MHRGPILKWQLKAAFQASFMWKSLLSSISTCFQVVSQSLGQVAHVLLTHPPLASNKSPRRDPWIQLARLACIRHAASVRPEPGSNSHFENELFLICSRLLLANWLRLFVWIQVNLNPHTAKLCSVFKVPTCCLPFGDATFYILARWWILVNIFFRFCFLRKALRFSLANK